MKEFKVLIVDDSPFMRKVFSDVIDADAAFKVLATAANGKEAVDLALELRPDIITMDLEMPHMNGIEALQSIMAVQPTPVIMLSAVTDNGTRDTIRALQYGAIDFIRKPDGAVKLDIHQVKEQLLEKLHVALETMSRGALKMLPAVQEKGESIPGPSPGQKTTPIPAEGKPKKSVISAALVPKKESEEDLKPLTMPPRKKSTELPAPAITESVPGNSRLRIDSTSSASTLASPLKGTTSKESLKLPSTKSAPASDAKTVTKKLISPTIKREQKTSSGPPIQSTTIPKTSTAFTHLVAMGTSTGGPRALHEVLTGIPADFPAPILIVQHMPPKFTHSLAQRLDNFCSIHVREAVDDEPIETATAYIAPGGKHMELSKDATGKYRIKLSDGAPKGGHKPSVDVLFESLIGHQQLRRHIVLMTGMGSDGSKGMKALLDDGAQTTIAEAEQTCVVYGMPRCAVELGAVTHQLPLQEIASVLAQEVKSRKL
ncbi:protein-glutamate methylesterase/protein-glutamine glutaminase [Cohnella mopanensis]|uniref:protein-glutamate methylesterase/protein-glutamine glutaminase n=1 Tax=Cohnella mopanensis TaxID=2911966 RepID=UPI001EF79D36|nr:chemotaxis response regulator protein-glutamate methylesterase [Cohnella mopanensis]